MVGFATLFDQPPYQRHSETSNVAAESFAPKAASVRGKVLEFIRNHGDATDEEIFQHFAGQYKEGTLRARRVELWHAGMVIQTTRTRKTRSGRAAAVWEAIGP